MQPPPQHPVMPLHFRPAVPLRQQPDLPCYQPTLSAENPVQVWAFCLNAPDEAVAYWHTLLSTEEQQRAGRFIHREQQRRWVAAHGLKREVLSAYLQKPPEQLKFVVLPDGKPVLQLLDHEIIYFNLSHSRDRLLLAVSGISKVGVDLEHHDTTRPFWALAQRFFHPDEVEPMKAMTEAAARRQFYRAWVAKEALLKAQGSGLKGGLARWPVPCNGSDQVELGGWNVHWLPLTEPGVYGALAVESEKSWSWISRGHDLHNTLDYRNE